MTVFSEGLQIEYKCQIGIVRFVCQSYLTFCVRQFDEKRRDVCILIPREEWKNIRLFKESEK